MTKDTNPVSGETPPLTKKDLDMLKFHLSSIFGRKHKYLYINPNALDVWYFTSVPPDWGYIKDHAGIFIHRNTILDYYHAVTIKDPTIVENLLRLLPMITIHPSCIVINELMAIVNKNKTGELVIREDGAYGQKSAGKKGMIEVKIIAFIDALTVDTVASVVSSMVAVIERAQYKSEVPIPVRLLAKADVVHLQTDWPNSLPDGRIPKIGLPLCDGFNLICCSEYLKRVPEEHTLVAMLIAEQAAARFIVRFENSKISVVSGIPAALWFPIAP